MTTEIDFTTGLTEAQKDFAESMAGHIDVQAQSVDLDVDCKRSDGYATLREMTTDDTVLLEARFDAEALRHLSVEVGQWAYERDLLHEGLQNMLHFLQLTADYLDGHLSTGEVREEQQEFEENHDFVRTGLNTLRFRKLSEETDE